MLLLNKGFLNGNNKCAFTYVIIKDVTEATNILESGKPVSLSHKTYWTASWKSQSHSPQSYLYCVILALTFLRRTHFMFMCSFFKKKKQQQQNRFLLDAQFQPDN